jgi:hypothetical protein
LGFVKITEWKKKEGFHCCSFVNVFKLKGFLYKLITGSRRLFKISIKYLGVRLIWRKKVFKPEKISSLRKKLVNDKYEILDFKKNLPFRKKEFRRPKDRWAKSTPEVVLRPGKKRRRLKFKDKR